MSLWHITLPDITDIFIYTLWSTQSLPRSACMFIFPFVPHTLNSLQTCPEDPCSTHHRASEHDAPTLSTLLHVYRFGRNSKPSPTHHFMTILICKGIVYILNIQVVSIVMTFVLGYVDIRTSGCLISCRNIFYLSLHVSSCRHSCVTLNVNTSVKVIITVCKEFLCILVVTQNIIISLQSSLNFNIINTRSRRKTL